MQRDGFQCLTIPRTGRYRFEVIGPSWVYDAQGAQIIGEDWLEKGEKITVALGQRGTNIYCGSGGTFVVKENRTLMGAPNPKPLFVAGGNGYAHRHSNFGKARFGQRASGNFNIGFGGVQKFFEKDQKDLSSCGAGFLGSLITGELRKDWVAAKSYKDGLIGGIGKDSGLTEGGFGGGGAWYQKNYYYYGAGGGYTGGGTEICDSYRCNGGGGGSFSIYKEAQFNHVREEYGKCTITYLD